MPGVDLSQISSNWRKLQEAEKSNRKPANDSIKRKRPVLRADDEARGPKRYKRSSLRNSHRSPSKMGFTQSTPNTTAKSLLEQHDLSPSDLTAAYGSFSSSSTVIPLSLPSDGVNAGLHQTHRAGKFLALDCEMVGTGPPPSTDSLLARVSIVNYNYEQVYDSYVQPPPNIRVTDYRTAVSGILPSHLRPDVARPYSEVQEDVAKLLHNRILIGHALRNDFAVLGFGHPRRETRDTSSWKPFRMNGGAPRLRDLAQRELGVRIQSGEHSSLEDARAAMGLFRKVKGEWETEVRKRFGAPRGEAAKGKGRKGRVENEMEGEDGDEDGEDEDEEGEEDEWDVLTGEEEEIEEEEERVAANNKTAQATKKKRKKKKRTKRK